MSKSPTHQKASKSTLAHLEQQITALTEKNQELENHLKRSLADYQNQEKRSLQERHSIIKYANSSLISSLLPAIELAEKALAHTQDQGVKMVLTQLKEALMAQNLEEINPSPGQAFDHHLHECIEVVEDSKFPAGTIAQTLSKGYRFRDGEVLKIARVTVYKHPEEKGLDSGI